MVLIFSMLFQMLFFEDFYLSKKIKHMTREALKFSDMYSYDISDEKLQNLIDLSIFTPS